MKTWRRLKSEVSERHPTGFELAWLATHRPRHFVDAIAGANRENARIARRVEVHCEICQSKGTPMFKYYPVRHFLELGVSPLRDNFICRECGSSLRQRALFGVAGDALRALQDPVVVDTDEFWPGATALRSLPGYVPTTYDPSLLPGVRIPGRPRNEDLTNLTFSDASVDMLISGDVHEHIEDTLAAFREVRRVLKPGGLYVFTVPFRNDRMGNQRLAYGKGSRLLWSGLEHLHGDPRSSRGGVVAYWLFGRELICDLQGLGFDVERMSYPTRGLEWVPVDIFVARAVTD